MKRIKLLALLLAALLLVGCGAKSGYTAADAAAPAAEMNGYGAESAEDGYSLVSSGSGDTATLSEQKLIKRVYIDAETEDLDALLTGLGEKISALGGYIESQERYNGSAYSSYRSRSANLTVRIPAENLDGFVAQVNGVSNVVSYTESQDDVTLTYVDTESRMKALQAEQDRLLELMEQAETMSDLLEIEERLTQVRYELESVTSQMRVLENKVSYATVELYISQVKVYTEVEEQTVWQRIGSGFSDNLRAIGEAAVDFLVWVVTYSPQLILLAAAAVVIVLLLKRRIRKRKAAKTENEDK